MGRTHSRLGRSLLRQAAELEQGRTQQGKGPAFHMPQAIGRLREGAAGRSGHRFAAP